MMPLQRNAHRPSDAGFTLVELMVTMVIFVIVALMISALLMNGFFTQQSVEGTTRSNANAQNTYAALNYDVRYAEEAHVSEAGRLLITRTWVGEDGETGSYFCRGWYYDAENRVLRRSTSPSATSGANAASAVSWPVFINNVDASVPFADTSDGIAITFTADPAGRGVATAMNVVLKPRPQIDSESPACF